MKKGLFTATLLLFVFGAANAQDEFEITNMGGGGFTIGYGNMNISGLNNFVPASVPGFSNDQVLLGGVGYGVIGRLVIGGGGSGISAKRFATDSIRGSVSGGYGTFDVGYILVNKTKLKFFPMIGIGGGGYGVSMSQIGNLSVGDLIYDKGHEIDISQGGLVADFSLNLFTIPALAYDKEEDSYGGFLIGLKIGYLYSVPSNSWSYAGGDITDGPNFGLNMPYAKLVLGGFGFNKAK